MADITLTFSVAGQGIKSVYCDDCKKQVSFSTYCNHFYCGKCKKMLGFASMDGTPERWNKEATETIPIPYVRMEPEKEVTE